jgi:DNA-directed RNA polymerase subunit RPC12/RpoP
VSFDLNIFSRNCPSCDKNVSWNLRKKLLKQPIIKCSSCSSALTIHPRDKFINIFMMWLIASSLNQILFQSSSQLAEIAIFIVMSFLNVPKYFNILFSLYEIPFDIAHMMKSSKVKNSRRKTSQ